MQGSQVACRYPAPFKPVHQVCKLTAELNVPFPPSPSPLLFHLFRSRLPFRIEISLFSFFFFFIDRYSLMELQDREYSLRGKRRDRRVEYKYKCGNRIYFNIIVSSSYYFFLENGYKYFRERELPRQQVRFYRSKIPPADRHYPILSSSPPILNPTTPRTITSNFMRASPLPFLLSPILLPSEFDDHALETFTIAFRGAKNPKLRYTSNLIPNKLPN